MAKTALILFPHQLFPLADIPAVDRVVLVEDPDYFGVGSERAARLHVQKLILHRASMRRYVEEVLWPANIDVDYVSLDVFIKTNDILERVKKFDHVYLFDPIDARLASRLLQARREREGTLSIEFFPSPNFYLKEQEVRQYFAGEHRFVFEEFYQWQRERFNVLIGDDYRPVGKRWTFDAAKHKSVPRDTTLPSFEVFGNNQWVAEATEWTAKHFPDNPGSTDFVWPTNHEEAARWLAAFVEHRIDHFGTYQDAIDGEAMWLYHSAVSASLNIGLLSPQQVVNAALERHARRPVDLGNLEAFIRSVLGWREFLRGVYVVRGAELRGVNPLAGTRRLTDAWYQGSTGLPPFDDMVTQLRSHAYAHDAERLYIAANLMVLCEIHPDDMYRWFQELLIDAYDWILLPTVTAIQDFCNPESVISLPIAASSHVTSLSHYTRGEWSNVWDGLYWRFVEKNRETLKKNPRTRILVQRLERLDADHRRIISYRADDFLVRYTR